MSRTSFAVLSGGALAMLCAQQSALAGQSPEPLRVVSSSVVSGGAPQTQCLHAGQHNNPQAVVDRSKRVTVVYTDGDGGARISAVSTDRGATWSSQQILPRLTSCSGNPDGGDAYTPYLAVGPEGRLYASTSWVNVAGDQAVRTGRNAARGYVSSAPADGPFAPPVEPDSTQATQRLALLADPDVDGRVSVFMVPSATTVVTPPVDPDSVLPERTGAASLGRIFLPRTDQPLTVRTSTDGGALFGPAAEVTTPERGKAATTLALLSSRGVMVALSSEVDLVASAAALASRQTAARANLARPGTAAASHDAPQELYASRSLDGGLNWGPRIRVGSYERIGTFGPEGFAIPDATSAPDGELFMTWPAPGGRVVVARSRDAGASWSHTVAATVPGEVMEPAIAARGDGRVGVAFYAITGDEVRAYAVATEDASIWSAPASFLEPFTYPEEGTGSYDGTEMGPAQDLVALPDGYGAAFTSPVAAGRLAVTFTRLR